jgi:hypothetical protein
MQDWNYLFIVVDYQNIHDPGRPRYVNGQELSNWKQGEDIFGVMNKLCWKGWEPVAFGLAFPVRQQLKRRTLLFRRQKT